MQAAPDISVVIPVRNGELFLPHLFAALEAQTLPAYRFEAIVVDDGSSDDTATLLAAWAGPQPEGRRVLHSDGGGPARARNVGIRAARGTWIVFTDADVMPYADWLETIAAAAVAEGVVAIEGSIESWPPDERGPWLHIVENRDGGRFMTANMAYRRELLEELGGFDERFADAFLEDSDLAFRTLDAGYTIPFLADARVRHRVSAPRTLDVLRSARKVRWLTLVARKHPARYREQVRPMVQPVTRVDLHILIGLAGTIVVAGGRGRTRLAGLAFAANGARVLARATIAAAPAGARPAHALLSVALAVCKAWWWTEGRLRFASVSR